MNNKRIICLTKNELEQVCGGIGLNDIRNIKRVVKVVVNAAVNVAIPGPVGAVAGDVAGRLVAGAVNRLDRLI